MYEPLGHVAQVAAPPVLYLVLSPQSVHLSAPAAANVPAPQEARAEPPLQAYPARQVLQLVRSVVDGPSVYDVEGHVLHTMAPSASEYLLSVPQATQLPLLAYFPFAHKAVALLPSQTDLAGHVSHAVWVVEVPPVV